MVSHLEGFIAYDSIYTPQKMGYIHPSAQQSLPAYMTLVQSEVSRMEREGIVASAVISSDLRILDRARQNEGVTLCCLIPDSIDENDLNTLFQCATTSKADGRFYFSEDFRKTNTFPKKTQELIDDQIGTVYQDFPFVYQDFVLLFTHDPRVERLISNNSLLSQYTTRFSLP